MLFGLAIWVCLSAAACRLQPMRVVATAKVTTDMPPVADAGPVAPMPVRHGGPAGSPAVAVIDVDGLLLNSDLTGLYSLGENPVALFRERLEAAAADPCVRAVVVRINSPGGGVTATDIMWHDLNAFKQRTGLPIVSALMDVAAGGGYYLATAADQVMAHPTTVTGGIGVILNVYNVQDAMAQFNILGTPVKSGEHIDLGTPIKALGPDERALLQSICDEFHARFRELVRQRRPEVDPRDATNFDGRVFTARQALDRKLIDAIGYLDDAIETAKQQAGLTRARVVFYHRQNDRPRSPYAITPNVPMQGNLLPLSLPGLDRTRLPSFLYLWQPEPTMERLSGR